MKTNNIIIGILVVVILVLVIGIGFHMMSDDTNSISVNNTTDNATNITNDVVNATVESSDDNSQNYQSQSSSSPKQYDDWQKDYETGDYDEDGNPIYRSVYSTSGGQSEPGVYEEYWSANGPISSERIG